MSNRNIALKFITRTRIDERYTPLYVDFKAENFLSFFDDRNELVKPIIIFVPLSFTFVRADPFHLLSPRKLWILVILLSLIFFFFVRISPFDRRFFLSLSLPSSSTTWKCFFDKVTRSSGEQSDANETISRSSHHTRVDEGILRRNSAHS